MKKQGRAPAGKLFIERADAESTGAEHFAIQFEPEETDLRLKGCDISATEALLQATDTDTVPELAEAISQAAQARPPDYEEKEGSYGATRSNNGKLQGVRFTGWERKYTTTPGEWSIERYVDIAVSGVMRFTANWSEPSVEHSPLAIQFGTPGVLADEAAAIGYDILGRYKKRFSGPKTN